ncbi:Protein of unknown function [Tangfeifania diversioriginum]|jgi:hypothetical protein|uniref:DNA-binding protein n=1 Tax=Tangfeifania diversioriginum TaxID=1168035 RepID=A0A1M6CM31_9BACT|nr:DUF3276 family protein [Tangfeifania diversioriginum]SHI62102.1 Protein of unknown function [Tangfeifania diversioriginum]
MERVDSKEEKQKTDEKFRQEIYSNVIRAGKRTYFFDVKSTRNDEYYLTITESKRRYSENGKFHYEKHKVFLYQEDFDKFTDSLTDVIKFIKENQPGEKIESRETEEVTVDSEEKGKDFTDVDFEDI